MPSRVVPILHPLPPLAQTILSDLYCEFKFVNSPYFPLAATSTVQHGVASETVCKWYREAHNGPLHAALAFNVCEDTLLFADVYIRPDSVESIRIKLRRISDIDRHGCYSTKAIALVSTEAEWRVLAESVVRPLVANAIERDRALGL